jgi:hypothetical protein
MPKTQETLNSLKTDKTLIMPKTLKKTYQLHNRKNARNALKREKPPNTLETAQNAKKAMKR